MKAAINTSREKYDLEA